MHLVPIVLHDIIIRRRTKEVILQWSVKKLSAAEFHRYKRRLTLVKAVNNISHCHSDIKRRFHSLNISFHLSDLTSLALCYPKLIKAHLIAIFTIVSVLLCSENKPYECFIFILRCIIGNIHHSASHRLDVKIHPADMYNTVFVRYLIAAIENIPSVHKLQRA